MSKIIDKNSSLLRANWQTPVVEELTEGQNDANLTGHSGPITAEQLELIKKSGYKEGYLKGFKKGIKEGNESGLQQASQTLQLLENVLETLAEPLKHLDEQVEQQFVRLVMIIVNQLVRRELKLDPGEVVGVVREALHALPVSSRNVQVFLCPEDISVVASILNKTDDDAAWKLVDDPTLSRGDCRIESEHSSIDASVERRLITIITDLLGGERETDKTLSPVSDSGSRV